MFSMGEERICRICLTEGDILRPIFCRERFVDETKGLHSALMECASVQIYENDGLPNGICTVCVQELHRSLNFRNLCERSDVKLRKDYPGISLSRHAAEFDSPAAVKFKSETGEAIELEGLLRTVPEIGLNYEFEPTDEATMDQDYRSCDLFEDIKIEVEETCIIDGNSLESRPDSSNSGKKKSMLESFLDSLDQKYGSTDKSIYSSDILINSKISEDLASPTPPPAKSPGKTRKYECRECGKSLSSKSTLSQHLQTHKKPGKRKSGRKTHECTVCGRLFVLKTTLRLHMAAHGADDEHRCRTCGVSLASKAKLAVHEAEHRGRRTHTCEICGCKFIRWSSWEKHVQSHGNKQSYWCNSCGRQFVTVQGLQRHRRTYKDKCI